MAGDTSSFVPSPPMIQTMSYRPPDYSDSPARPQFARRETEQILDYYQSPDAGRTYVRPIIDDASSSSRTPSSSAPSSRHPSARDLHATPTKNSHSGVQRRPSAGSSLGADHRRLAIVELDPSSESSSPASSSPAIQTPPSSSPYSSSSTNLFARRGMDRSRLALVAPPDASPTTYTLANPPASAPAKTHPSLTPKASSKPTGHNRSNSDTSRHGTNTPKASSSRERSGGLFSSSKVSRPVTSPRHKVGRAVEEKRDLVLDINVLTTRNQTPRSRTPQQPALNHDLAALSARGWTVHEQDILTPAIGQSKDINARVAGPVVMGLGVEEMWMVGKDGPQGASSDSDDSHYSTDNPPPMANFLVYDPILHATAGPLPPPPRFTLTPTAGSPPPPRPPRLHSPPPPSNSGHGRNTPIKSLEPLTSTESGSQRLTPDPLVRESDYSIIAMTASSNEDESDDYRTNFTNMYPYPYPESANSVHIREGAFPPESVFITHSRQSPAPPSAPSPPQHPTPRPPSQVSSNSYGSTLEELVAAVDRDLDDICLESSMDVPPSESLKDPKNRSKTAIETDRSSQKFEASPSVSPTKREQPLPETTRPPPSPKSRSVSRAPSIPNLVPPPPPPTEVSCESGIHGLSSPSAKRFSTMAGMARPASVRTHGNRYSLYYAMNPQSPKKRKLKSSWPTAMNFSEVLREKTTFARFKGYAIRINELATEDCGLADWIMAMKGRNNLSGARRPSAFTGNRTGEHRRMASEGSITSEVTFPVRALDASAAIDLTYRPIKDSPPRGPPTTLPYPSLAEGIGIRPTVSTRTFTLASPTSLASTRTLPSQSSKTSGASNFFATIGRRASIKRTGTSATSSDHGHAQAPRKLQSSRAPPMPSTRAPQLSTPPTIPGGPRAPKRSSTVMLPPKSHYSSTSDPPRSSLDNPASDSSSKRSGRTPSFPGVPYSNSASGHSNIPSPVPIPPIPRSSLSYKNPYSQRNVDTGELFRKSLDKLCDVLPAADRDVLSGYLRRAGGQELVAIGAFLEDQKEGKIKRP